MIYLKWALFAPFSIVATILCVLFAPIIALYATMQDGLINNGNDFGLGPRLPSWLSWFQTPDNSLDGDNGWKTEHWQWRFSLPAFLCAYVGRVGWLWRNPGYGFGVVRFNSAVPVTATYAGNQSVNDSPGIEGYCLVNAGGLFQLVWIKRITANKCIYVNIGWNIKGLINEPRNIYIATFAFSPRISTFKV